MSLLINFKDAVNAAALDPNATHAVYYMDGDYANEAAVRNRCPKAKLYAITVRGATGKGIFACDSETGDLTVEETMAWNAEQIKLGVHPIVDYADQDRWLNEGLLAQVEALEKAHGVEIEKWDADYDGVAAVPSWASAKQYMDGNADLNVALANFFGDAPPATPTVDWWSFEGQIAIPRGSTGTVRAHVSVPLDGSKRGQWSIGGLPGIVKWSGPGGGKWRIAGMPTNSKPLG